MFLFEISNLKCEINYRIFERLMFAPVDDYVPQCGPQGESLRRRILLVWGLSLLVSLSFVALIVLAPLMMARGQEHFARPIYDFFSYLCHQLPTRSFYLEGHQFAVCSRCTGMYAGIFLGFLFYPLIRSFKRRDAPAFFWLVIGMLPAVIDFALGYLNIWENTHLSRFITGAIFGAVAATFILAGLLDLSQASRWRVSKANGNEDDEARSQQTKAPLKMDREAQALSDYSTPTSRI